MAVHDNKYPVGGTFGDPDWNQFKESPTAAEQNADVGRDGAGIPQTAGWNSNKFPVNSPLGDADPTTYDGSDQAADVSHDMSGVNNPDQGESQNKDLALEPNKFPRETGHDTLTGDEVILT